MRFFLAALTLPLALASPCPFSGTPVLLPPRHLAQDRNLRHSLNRLTATLDSAVAGTINPGFRGNDTSFSIILTDASETLWEYHHTATATVQGTKKVDSNSQFRIASITKMLTDLLLLRLGLDLDEKITTYLPLLAGGKKKGRLEWEAVTLRDLGSHMSGVEEQYGYPEDYSESTRKFWTGLGLPALPREDYPICDVTGMGNSTNRCTMDLIVQELKESLPTFPLHSKPAYSNIAFSLLASVVTNVTGLSYESAIEKYIVQPLDLNRTSFSALTEANMVIPPLESANGTWEMDFATYNAAGGAYSTTHDLSILVRALISPTPKILPQQAIDAWLKPLAFGTRIGEAVGFPWEITRTNQLSHRGVVDIYAKDGGIPGYTSRFALLPAFGVGFVVLNGGDGYTTVPALAEAVLAAAFPAVEAAGTREAVQAGYVGRFSAGKNNWMEVVMDGDGLRLVALWSNGVDFYSRAIEIGGVLSSSWRLYPTGISNGEDEDWRVVIDEVAGPLSELPSMGVFAGACHSWQTVDAVTYGGESVDKIVFKKKGGKVVAVELSAFRITMKRDGKGRGRL